MRSCADRLDHPPAATARARLSEDFGRRFVIFGDAEEEFDWHQPLRRDQTSTAAIASLPAATRRLNDRAITPTYLLDYPVVDNARSARTIRQMVEDGACTIGTQLHPWVNPPFEELVSGPNSFAGRLPVELERAKIAVLTERIADSTGHRPVVYRAGRYGVGPNTARLLAEAGYQLDVSVRSHFDYSPEGGPDFTGCPVWPWWAGDRLLEVPLTTGFVGLCHRWPDLHQLRRLRRPLAAAGLLARVPLTPEGTPLREALTVIRHLLHDGVRLFSLSFHTPSVEIGHTPYVRDEADLTRFWRWWDGVFDLFAREGVEPAGPRDILAAAS